MRCVLCTMPRRKEQRGTTCGSYWTHNYLEKRPTLVSGCIQHADGWKVSTMYSINDLLETIATLELCHAATLLPDSHELPYGECNSVQ